jgi:hypothetical protein
MTGRCYFCGAVIEEKVYRGSVCPQCGRDLKSCVNCEFYSPGSHWDCRETISEPVKDKERANFCDFFRLSNKSRAVAGDDGGSIQTGGAAGGGWKEKHKKAFDSLFED